MPPQRLAYLMAPWWMQGPCAQASVQSNAEGSFPLLRPSGVWPRPWPSCPLPAPPASLHGCQLRHPKKTRVQTCVAAGRLYSWAGGKDRRSQRWVIVVPWTAGGHPSAQASPAISGCFCRRCLSRVARRPKGTQQWGHAKRGPLGPRPCMRRWRLSLLLWAQA